MTKKVARLGENAFIQDQEIFLPVDTEREGKTLHKQGQTNGRKNSPDSQASLLDAVERGIIEKIAQTAQQTRDALNQHFVGFFDRLLPIVKTWDPMALINQIQDMPNRLAGNLDDMLRKFKIDSAIRGPEWRGAKDEYEKFRKDNHLIRPPDYHTLKSISFWFFVLITVEAALNATLFWELMGIFIALGVTILITSVNVLLGASLVGLFLRYKNHVSKNVRWATLICIPVSLAILVFNFGVGHYRDALDEAKVQSDKFLVSEEWDDASTESIDISFLDQAERIVERIIDSPLGISSVLSVLLIIVGIGFFLLATYKWYSMFDSYPGYRKLAILLKKTHKNYENLVETTRTKLNREIKGAEDRTSDERTKVINMRTEHTDLLNRAKALKEGYAKWIVVLGKKQSHLLALYRDNNRQARSEPAPNHFNSEILIDESLTDPPKFNPPDLGDVEKVIEAVGSAESRIKEIADKIWQEFNQLSDMNPNQTNHGT